MNKLKNSERLGYIEVLTGGTLWGFIGVFVLEMSKLGASSGMTSFLRMSFAFAILALITIAKHGINAFKVSRKTLFVCVLLGLICHGIYNVFYNIAVVRTGITTSAVLLNVAPVFTAAASRILFRERITPQKALALAINIIGCVLAVTGGSISLSGLSVAGILFGIGAGFCYSMTAIIGRLAGDMTNAYVMSTYSYLAAAVFIAIFMHPWSGTAMNAGILIWGFLYALIPTAIAYIFYYNGVQKIKESSKVPVFASTETVAAAIIGIVLYHEQIGIINIIGIILVLLSVVLMNVRRQQYEQ